MKKLFIVICLLYWVNPAASNAAAELQSVPINLLNRQYLLSQNWINDANIVALVKKWSPYHGTQGFADKNVMRTTSISLTGVTLHAEYRVYKRTGVQEIAIYNTGKFKRQACADIETLLRNKLGQPTTISDDSTSMTLDTTLEWEIGKSRIRYGCSVLLTYNISLVVYVMISNADSFTPLLKSIPLLCTVKSRIGGENQPAHKEPPFKIILDQRRKNIEGDTVLVLGTVDSFSNDDVFTHGSFPIKDNGDVSWKFHLDRSSGSYTWDGRSTSDSMLMFQKWGQCRKILPDNRT